MIAMLRHGLTVLAGVGWLIAPALAETADPGTAGEPDKPAVAEVTDEAAARAELYHSGDYRIARPGARPVSNFYGVRGFQPVDPGCYAGIVTSSVAGFIPLGGGAKFYADERIRVRARRSGGRFNHSHGWQISSDPVEMMGVVTTSEGAGAGAARVMLALDIEHGIYRLVTDVRPRAGTYVISSAGGGLSRTKTEDFHFAFGDHHYSYVNLAALEAKRAIPAVQQTLNDIHALLSNRPPNVFMGFFDWARDAEGTNEGELLIEDEDGIALAWGAKVEGRRNIHIRIFCGNVLRRYEARWGAD